jgi:Uma2 family endonuclease
MKPSIGRAPSAGTPYASWYAPSVTQPWLDPDDPRAPTQAQWDTLSAEERERVVRSLPSDIPLELHPPEGDPHRKPKERARDALDEFFRRIGRRVYVSSELVTYYPGEPRFCPDILAVLDVEPHDRSSWVVSREGKGLDLVIEIHASGDERKDLERNVELYARLGIPEYFVFDRPGARILGWRAKSPGASYERLVPQSGRLASGVLGLDLTVESGMLRFYNGSAPLLFMDELVGRLNSMVAELADARDTALRRAGEETRRAEEETRRANTLETENATLRAELERLRRER